MNTNMVEALRLSWAGMVIVFTSLILIAFAIALMSKIDETLIKRKAEKNLPEPEPEQTLDNTTLVLITAAVTAVLEKKRFRLSSVRRIVSRDAKIAGWTMEGRSVLHGSHVLNIKSDK